MMEHKLSLPDSTYTLKFDERTGVMYVVGRDFDHASGNNWDPVKLHEFGMSLVVHASIMLAGMEDEDIEAERNEI